MNESDNVKVFNTSDNSLSATISLPYHARPNSFGNFIGPLLPYNITVGKSGICAIIPYSAGVPIPVNALGRRFAISGSGCKVLIDGVAESGTPTSYTFSSVAADHTIFAADPTISYTLSGDWTSSVGGYLVSTPSGITGTPVAVKSASFLNGLKVTLQAQSGFKVQSGTWGGDCTGAAIVGDTCVLTMTGVKTWGTPTIIGNGGQFYKGSTWYQDWASCGAAVANGDHVKATTDVTSLTTTGTAGRMIYLSNQWSKTDANTKGTYTSMTLTIADVGVTVEPSDSIVL
jgi:hypothetical protein